VNFTLIAVIVTALFFDFTNGFHDTANSIATSVSTRALSPRMAVLTSAILNFAGAFFFFAVAATIAKGIVNPEAITLNVVLAALVGAITWNLITWYLGIPSSSSHALVGGIIGASVSATGSFAVVNWDGLKQKVLAPSLLAPVAGFVGAAVLMTIALWIIRKRSPAPVNRVFRRLQLVSGGFVAFTHGTNDAQKTMGVIALALIVSGHLAAEPFTVPVWVKLSSATAMALGTYAGGWRIIRTLGQRIVKLDPPQGFAAQTSTAATLWLTARYGYPVSTTYVISGGVLGAGASTRLSAVRWGVAGNILVAWLITIPCAGLVGAAMEYVTRLPGGDVYVFLLTAGIAALAFSGRRLEARREARRYRMASAPAAS
jgi:inorganic phosphate transporter, PiT family